jgi:serine/threonine protein phosphatase PrpC
LPNDSFYQTIDNVNDNDMILVATDGLYNFIENNLINSLIEKTKFSAISKELTDIALKNGSNDNITSILLKFGNGK